MVRVYRYRLYPTKAQEAVLYETCERLRELYNAALQERRDAYRKLGVLVRRYDQEKSLKEVREVRPEYRAIHTHLLRDPILRLDRAFQAFFRRIKRGEKPGYPRFKGTGQYKTFTFPDAVNRNGAAIDDDRLRLTGIGHVKIKLHRPYEGTIKQVSVTLDGDGHWYAALICKTGLDTPLPVTGESVGVDVGTRNFAALSTGETVDNPRPLVRAYERIVLAQRVVAQRVRGSHRRRKAVRLLAKQHARVRNTRMDFHHKLARNLVERFDSIAIEDLNVKGLAGGMLAGSVHDAGWAQFAAILSNKAESAGRTLVRVDPRGTSQECSGCGAIVRKALSVRVHRCQCGTELDRDTNAALNIQRRGQRLREESGYAPSI